jgi:hypothetical protein
VEIMRIRQVASTFAAAALIASAVSAPASAATGNEPGATLTLSWQAPQASNQVFTTTLTCAPDAGGEDWYLDPVAACTDLRAGDGDFHALPGRLLSCAGVSGWAIRTTATGHWHGQPVSYDETHANWCEARRKLGASLF